MSHVDFAAMAQDGRLSKLSVKELKSYLYHTDASLSGNKKELTERVAECVSGGGGDGGDAGAGGGGGGADGGGGAGGAPGGAGAGGAGGAAVGGSSAAGMGYVNGASTQGVNGAAMNAAESDEELAHLSSLPPPPSAGDDVSPALFNPNAGNAAANNAADDFLIDEVFLDVRFDLEDDLPSLGGRGCRWACVHRKGAGAAVRGHGAHKRRGGARMGRARLCRLGWWEGAVYHRSHLRGRACARAVLRGAIGKGKPGRECVGARRARGHSRMCRRKAGGRGRVGALWLGPLLCA